MADVDFETPGNAPGGDSEDVGVRRSGRKIKPATFADGTAVDTFIKKSLSDLEDDSEAEAEAEKAQKEARAAAAMAKLEAAFAVDDNSESDVEDVTTATAAADNGAAAAGENDENEIPEILVGADGANPIKKAGSNKDGRQILECNYDDDCEFKTTNLGKMTNHIAGAHLQSKDHECPHCEFATATKDQLKKHINRKHFSEGRRRRYRCKQCGKKFLSRQYLDTHVSVVHEGIRPYECEYCLKTFGMLANLNTHVTAVHEGKRPHQCKECDYKAISKYVLQKHMESKHSAGRSRDKQCPLCPHKTYTQAMLRNHFRNMHGAKDRFCPICFKSYATETMLSMHMREVHLKEKPYQCQLCDYKAARKSHMSSHMAFKHPADGVSKKKVPPRPKRFKCSQCEYRAASKVIVAKHFRARHTEFGKYKCKECPYITSQKPNLDFHYKFKHEVMNTEACTMCFYTTHSEEYLKRHVRVVHDKWRYIECMACEYQAPTETHMHWHMQRDHGTMSRLEKPRFGLRDNWHPEYDNYDADYDDADFDRNYDNNEDDYNNYGYNIKSEPGISIKADPSTYLDWNEDHLEEQREIEAMLKQDPGAGADSDGSDEQENNPDGVRRSGRRRKPSKIAKDALASLRAAQAKEQAHQAEAAAQRRRAAPPVFRPAIVRPNAEQHLAQLQESSIMTGEVIAEGPITYTPQALDQVTTYVVTDSTGEIVATEGGITTVTNEAPPEPEDPNNLQFELTTVDDSGMPITFQVAAMDQDQVAQQVVTFDAADVAADEIGGREGVKNSFQCNECFKMFKNRRQLSAHEAAVHLKEKPFGCELCPYRASRKQHIKSHMETHKRRQLLQGEAGKIKCPQCDYSHDDQFYIDCHVKLQHEGAEQLICPHCDFSSQTTYRLQKHVDSVHNKIKNFACELCDYRCAEKGSLKIHVQIVHERVKAYKCEHCDFAAYVSSHLTYHMRSKHEKRMDFECDECDKAFVDMRALRSHKSAVHLKEKPFKCTLCDYRANRKQHIKVHMKTHMGSFMGTVEEAMANVEGPDEEEEPLDESGAAIEEQIAEEEEAIIAEEEAAAQLAAVKKESASEAEMTSGMEESEAESTASGSGKKRRRRKRY